MASRDAYQKLCGLVAGSRSSAMSFGDLGTGQKEKNKKATSRKLQATSSLTPEMGYNRM